MVGVLTNSCTLLSFPPRSATTPQEGIFAICPWLVSPPSTQYSFSFYLHTFVRGWCPHQSTQYSFSFYLHTFSIAEKVCKKARQKGASTHKANAGPLPMHRDCRPHARQTTSICLLIRHCEVRSNLSAIIDDLSVVCVLTNSCTHLSFPPRSATTPQEGNFRHCWCFSIAAPTIFIF